MAAILHRLHLMDTKKLIVLQRWLGSKYSREGAFDRKIPQRVGRLWSVQMTSQPGRETDTPEQACRTAGHGP